MRIIEKSILLKPLPPYLLSPHIETFTSRSGPVPCIYSCATCRRLAVAENHKFAYSLRLIKEGMNPLLDVKLLIFKGEPHEIERTMEKVLDIKTDFNDVLESVRGSPCLELLVKKWLGVRPCRFTSLYEALVVVIPQQQISLRIALERIRDLILQCGEKVTIRGDEYYGVPAPEKLMAMDISQLKRIVLSTRKAETIKHVAHLEYTNELPSILEIEGNPYRAVEELINIPGIGRWTAATAVSMVLSNYQIGVPWDLAVRKGYARVCGGRPISLEVEKILSNNPYRGLIMYLLSLEHLKVGFR
ncbi:MAG: hypothetical protein QXL15_05005 [Candidatus Korarchaeota archaeon]